MNDLYQRIGVSPEATAGQIADACRGCDNRRIHDAAVHILLDENRRAAYDRIYRQLTRIGQLRANLGLNYSEHWQVDFEDFECEPTLQGSLLDRMERRYGSRQYQFWRKNWRWILGGIWITLFSCAVGFLFARQAARPSTITDLKSFSHPVFALPTSGVLTKKAEAGNALVNMRTEPFGANCLVKLIPEDYSKLPILIFVRSGETVPLKIAAGNYGLRVAAGTDWYGAQYLFGPRTVTMALEESLTISTVGELELRLPELKGAELIPFSEY
ncbi:hypothetical protein BVY04_03595 [bacterium M21]|nr:hypothetical protein BVY04_03595 [bacterium M21]